MINETDDIKVSVCVVTYNQEKYIAECLDSLVSQETDFKFEIIVGEDCSTDGTRAIVQQYVDKYPDIVKPIFHKNNVGAVENVKQVYIAAKGKYIAHMDGDDMALPTKLQEQFDIMEKNPQAIICSHKVLSLSENLLFEEEYWNYPEGEYGFIDLVKKLPFFAHSSKFFRVTDEDDLYNILCDVGTLDVELHLHQASKGTIMHLNKNLGVYRLESGISAIKNYKINSKIVERVDFIYEKLLESNFEIKNVIEEAYAKHLLNTAYSYSIDELNTYKSKKYIKKSIKMKVLSIDQLIFLLIINLPFGKNRVLKSLQKLKKMSSKLK